MASWFDKLRDKAVDAGMSSGKTSKPSTPRPEPDAERVAANQRELDSLRHGQEVHEYLSSLPKAPEPKADSPQEQQLRQMLEESHKNPETPEEAAAWEKANEEFPSEWNLTPEQEEHLRRHGSVRTTEGDRYTDWYMRETSKDLDDYWGKQLEEKLQKREPKHPEWNEPAREKL